MKTSLYLLLCLFAAAGSQAAEVRKLVSHNGRVTYTNVAPRPIPASNIQDAASDVLPAAIIGAVGNVISMSYLVSKSQEFCGRAVPAGQARFQSAAHGWQRRNAAVVVQKDRVLGHSDQVLVAQAMGTDAMRRTDDMLRPVMQGSAPEKNQWCERTFADIDRGTLDLVGRAAIAPLMQLSR